MINEIDASAIVRDDLRLHFRTPMTQTINTVRAPASALPSPSLTNTTVTTTQIQEEFINGPGGLGGSSFTVTMSKAGVSVAELPVELERVARVTGRERTASLTAR
jgi:hypothetical protein